MLLKNIHTLTYQVFAEGDHFRLDLAQGTVKIWMHDLEQYCIIVHNKKSKDPRTSLAGCIGCGGCSTGTKATF